MGETQYTKSFPDLQKSLQKKDKKDKALQDLEEAKTRIRNLDYQYLNYHNNSVNAGSLKSYGKYPIDELIGLSTNLNPDSKDFLKNYSHFDDIIIGLTLKRSKKGNQYNEIWEDYVSIFRAVDGDSRAHADVKTEIRNSFPELSDKYSQKYFSNFMKKYYELYENGTIDKKLRKELGEGYGEVKKALKAARDNIQKAIDTFSEIDNAIEEVKGAYEDAKAALEAWKAKAQQITDEEVKSQNMADIQLMENQLNEDYSLDRLKELMDLEKKYLEHIKKVLESVRLSGYETKFVSDGFKADDFSKELYKKKNYYDVIVEGEGKIEDLLKWLKEEVFKKLEALNKGDFKKEADKKEKDVLDDTDPEDSKLEIPKLPEVGDMGVPESPEGKPSDDGKKSALSALSNSIKFFADAGSLANLLENSANVLLLTEYGTEMFTNYLDREGADTENTKQKLLSGIEISKIASPYRGAEVEYIIFGGSSGQEAINSAANRIRLIRFGLNLVYSFTDSEITSFISAASAVAGPFAPALKIVLHALISYAETEIDINLLMEHGKSIPIFKSSKTWILKPTGAVSFLANTAKELTKKAINRTSTDIYNWMEKESGKAKENLQGAVNKMKEDITGAIDNAIKTKIIQPILELVKDKSAAFKNGYIKTGEELTKAIEKEIDNICLAIDKISIPGADAYFNKEEIKSAIKNSAFIAELKSKIEEYSKMDLTKLVAEKLNEINDIINKNIRNITNKIENKIKTEVENFKNEILAEAKEGLDNLSEKSKKAISDKIDAFTNKLGSKSGGKSMSNAKKSILEFSYPEYLKLFMLLDYIGTVDGENDSKLARMYALMKDNLKSGEYKADIDNLSTVFRVDTQVDVETLILGKKAPSGNDLDIYMKNLTKSERTYNFTFSDVSGY